MLKHLVSGGAFLLASLFVVTPALATINPESFDLDPSYITGNALSAYFWTGGNNTAGVLDIENVGGVHNKVAKLTANGPDPGPLFPAITGKVDTGWGGPGRASNKLWFAVDIEKGTGDGSTSLTDFIWNLAFARGNNANILTLDGGLTTFRLKTVTGNTAAFNLHDGWNQIGVLNDTGANPNTILYLDNVQVATIHALSGPLTSGTTAVDDVALQRQSRGGTGDHFVGMMRFDNIITANENILVPEPSTFVLAGLGLASLLLVRRRSRA